MRSLFKAVKSLAHGKKPKHIHEAEQEQLLYVLKFWLLEQSFLNPDSFLNSSLLNRDLSVLHRTLQLLAIFCFFCGAKSCAM